MNRHFQNEDLKNEEDLENEDKIQNEGNLKNEAFPQKLFCPPPTKVPKILLMTSHLDSHTTTDVKPDMLSGVQTGNGIPPVSRVFQGCFRSASTVYQGVSKGFRVAWSRVVKGRFKHISMKIQGCVKSISMAF